MKIGKAKLFKVRKDLDGCFHRGKKGRKARKAKAHKRSAERQVRRRSKELCKDW
jgi:hypothetical protein